MAALLKDFTVGTLGLKVFTTIFSSLSLQSIKEILLIPDGGFSRTPPKVEGLGE